MIKRFLKELLYKYKNTSYAQAGEDVILQFLFNDIRKGKTITYLDLGTNIPDYGNNTYWFYRRHSRGVCVEADPTLIKEIKRVRPKDKIINAGVTVSDEKEADFYIFDTSSISTFNKNEAEKRSSSGENKIVKIAKVPLININNLIGQNFSPFPDLISIDIEGLDLVVLKSLDFEKFPIPVLCVETCAYSETHIRPKDLSIANFLLSKGYEVYADSYINTIFVNRKWFYNI
jgi:FkbM family methyltransferase